MLEFLRKHQYRLMLVVAILTIIAFVFLYDKNTYSQGTVRRGTAFKVYGKGYGPTTCRSWTAISLSPRSSGCRISRSS